MNNDRFKIHTHTGEVIVEQIVPPIEGKPAWNGHRAEIQNVLFEYAVSLGIPIKMGKKVVEWKEDGQSAWVVLDDGEIVKGDLVVAANGLMSKAKAVILASHNQSNSEDDISHLCREKSSGYSVYRAWYDATEMGIDKDPLTKVFAERDTHMGWLGKDVHFLVASMKEGKAISWVATHRVSSKRSEPTLTIPLIEQ